MKTRVVMLGAMSVLLMLACSLFTSEEPPVEVGEVEAVRPSAESTEAPLVSPSATAEVPEVTATTEPLETASGCTLDARFAEDITVPDNTAIEGGEAFRKTWRIRNAGTCDWEVGTQWVFASGDPLGGPASVSAPAAAAGAEVDVSVDFVAPQTPGVYRSTWQLQTPDGRRFGSLFYVKIVVPEVSSEVTELPFVPPTGDTSGCSTPFDPEFLALVDQAESMGIDLGCPRGSAADASGAFQEYLANVDDPDFGLHYRSLMIWTTPYKLGEIYVVQGFDTSATSAVIKAAYDTWDESQPEVPPACAGMEIPPSYLMPIRGFGKHWCEQQLWNTVGWAVSTEKGVDLRVQHTEKGRVIKVSGPNMYSYLIAWRHNDGKATVRIVSP